MSPRAAWRLAIGALVSGVACAALGGCGAEIPDGVYACDLDNECPAGFSCRADESDPSRRKFCYAGKGPAPGGGGGDGGAGRGTGGRGGRGGSDGGEPMPDAGPAGGSTAPRVLPSGGAFTTVGARRSGDGIAVYDDGFELDGRRCTADGELCVTGGFSP